LAREDIEFLVGDGKAGQPREMRHLGPADVSRRIVRHDGRVYEAPQRTVARIRGRPPRLIGLNPPDTQEREDDHVSYLLRVILPDRPGALGAVATALGEAGADILSVDVIERSSHHAVDDLVVDLPPDRLADSLVTAARSVPGVRVESIRPYA